MAVRPVFDVGSIEAGRIVGLEDGGIVRDHGADPRRYRHGLRALASVYEEVLQGAAGHQESAGESSRVTSIPLPFSQLSYVCFSLNAKNVESARDESGHLLYIPAFFRAHGVEFSRARHRRL